MMRFHKMQEDTADELKEAIQSYKVRLPGGQFANEVIEIYAGGTEKVYYTTVCCESVVDTEGYILDDHGFVEGRVRV